LGTTLHHSKSAVNGSVFTKLYFASKLSDLGTEDRQKSLRGVEVWTKRNTPYRPILISADAKNESPCSSRACHKEVRWSVQMSTQQLFTPLGWRHLNL